MCDKTIERNQALWLNEIAGKANYLAYRLHQIQLLNAYPPAVKEKTLKAIEDGKFVLEWIIVALRAKLEKRIPSKEYLAARVMVNPVQNELANFDGCKGLEEFLKKCETIENNLETASEFMLADGKLELEKSLLRETELFFGKITEIYLRAAIWQVVTER